MSILKIKSVGGGAGQFPDAGNYYFNINRLTCVLTSDTSDCFLTTDVKSSTGNASLCFKLVSSSDKAIVRQAVLDAIKSNPGGNIIDLKLPESVTITAIDALFFEV
jgi:hypothetical protein